MGHYVDSVLGQTFFISSYWLKYFPPCWKFALSKPVPEKDEPYIPSNYQPTAFLSSFSKTLETILNRTFHKYLLVSNLLPDRYPGFFKVHYSRIFLIAFSTYSWSSSRTRFQRNFCCCLWHVQSLNKFGTCLCSLKYSLTDSVYAFVHFLYLPFFSFHLCCRRR